MENTNKTEGKTSKVGSLNQNTKEQNELNYWTMSKEDRATIDKIEAENSAPTERYYLWDYCKSYGWRQMGNSNGYATIEELKKDGDTYQYNLRSGTIQQIMKAVVVEEAN